ncbi:hypothetical protein AADG42_01545 [Ammonicoccus fulvus]|uniref:Bacterial Ig domain-containing protein n=1 Tax=Ammonicoccus fulvus TaxID=3138240 RepID=A0ABZ3FJ44_9ACTN
MTVSTTRRTALALGVSALAVSLGAALVPAALAAPTTSPTTPPPATATAAPTAAYTPDQEIRIHVIPPTSRNGSATLTARGQKPGLPISVTVTDGTNSTSAKGVIDAKGNARLAIKAPKGGWKAGTTYTWGSDISTAAAGGGEFTTSRNLGQQPSGGTNTKKPATGSGGGLARTGV